MWVWAFMCAREHTCARRAESGVCVIYYQNILKVMVSPFQGLVFIYGFHFLIPKTLTKLNKTIVKNSFNFVFFSTQFLLLVSRQKCLFFFHLHFCCLSVLYFLEIFLDVSFFLEFLISKPLMSKNNKTGFLLKMFQIFTLTPSFPKRFHFVTIVLVLFLYIRVHFASDKFDLE